MKLRNIRVENYTFKKINIAGGRKTEYPPSGIRIAAEVFPDFSIPCLAREFIIIICTEGKANLKICGNNYRMKPGFSACILPDDFFSINETEAGEFFCSCIIIFVPERCVGIEAATMLKISRAFIKDITSTENIPSIIRFRQNISSPEIIRNMQIRNDAENIMLDILSSSPKITQPLSPLTCKQNQNVFAAAIYIHSNYKKSQLYLDDIAGKLHCSPQTLSKNFKILLKQGFKTYTKNLRLRYAAALLSTTRMSVSEISKICKIDSPSYLITQFKKKYKTTPIIYRKRR